MPERNIPRYVVFLTVLFIAAFLTGFLAPIPGKMDLFGTLKDSLEPILSLPPWKMFFVILLNNTAKSFAVLLSGILFGIVPLVAVATNGYVLGVAYLFASGEVGYVLAAKAVLPYGVLEIPAVLISAAYGLWLGMTFAKRIRRRDMAGSGDQVRRAIRMFFKVAFPLFVLAALIETFLIFSMGGGVPR
ncbi:MAG: stage II sporulation protein M [Candidatus Deferrimicrobiaceae bacterium]